MNRGTICDALTAEGYGVKLWGYSALDSYMGFDSLPFTWVETDADISALARLFEGIRFPGAALADAVVDGEGAGEHCYFRCIDPDEKLKFSFSLLSFTQDWKTRRFQDPGELYPLIREMRDGRRERLRERPQEEPWWGGLTQGTGRYRALMDAALILARYDGNQENDFDGLFRELPGDEPPRNEEQRVFLCSLLLSPHPGRGFTLLKSQGFIDEIWPELALMDQVNHSKEFHPEGNVWDHTLETFRYRKTASRGAAAPRPHDLRLSLGLLLHDLGKPLSESSGSRRFDGHAELGARAAGKFLRRLEFDSSFIEDIFYLIKNHMLPAALPRLPLQRTGEVMASPLFPTLMELYRCDESSSFKGLDGYYQSSAAYQSYLRNRMNPYRSADGKKLSGSRKRAAGKF
ncbi:hypothetical protein AGMMS49928_03470 [Spirochaetia bacterium]|nr:hypothetical protein AGMMS49928_03470 [Spirochaetia bacterium]